ncbi:helicase [Halogranum gelatinilyticum]|uniref:ATP-dependent DNA helicase Hel308 n=1 Tax=Halogranum gelatinilyticum TaxID=660521 RepID=A0A1G9R9P6_9EURY|nr:DEAD/DEAH box helicase [Halogranum gelatinilyticum]SDM19944.1 helicase [Halogranum gelatinilyticum]
MHVRDLPLPDPVLDHYESQGIERLYPPQAEAVESGITDGGRLVAAIPTASGKTLIAELAMLTADGPGLYICPLRALAREKYETFSALPGVSVGISTGDYDSPAEELAEHDIVVATSEKVDSAIRNGADWVADLACVVVDEVHLLGAEGRGPTLEVTLANLQRRAPGVQIVALSATVDNPEDIADWLDADLVKTTWRPVDLRTGVYADGLVEFNDGTELRVDVGAVAGAGDGTGGDVPASEDDETEATVALVADAVHNAGGQCLAFVRSRREAENLAERLAREELGDADTVAADLRAVDDTGTGRRLADCVESGVAFHHAGLRSTHRAVVETAFRNRDLKVICATPTLAAGVNVPARRVVVRDQERYTGSAMEPLPVLEVQQMCGRAGRPHLDPYGEAVLVGDERSKDELEERYVDADPEAVESKLRDRTALRTHVLSIVATGFADSRETVLDTLEATFYAHGTPVAELADIVEAVIAELAEMGMLTDHGGSESGTGGGDGDPELAATVLGAQVSKQYVAPESGARIVDGLRTAVDMDPANVTGLTVLQFLADTPDMQDTYLGNRERAAMYQYARDHNAEFTVGMHEAETFERWLETVKTARILYEWTEGESMETIVETYRIGPGDLESRVERAEWLLGAAEALATLLDLDVPELARIRSRL